VLGCQGAGPNADWFGVVQRVVLSQLAKVAAATGGDMRMSASAQSARTEWVDCGMSRGLDGVSEPRWPAIPTLLVA